MLKAIAVGLALGYLVTRLGRRRGWSNLKTLAAVALLGLLAAIINGIGHG